MNEVKIPASIQSVNQGINASIATLPQSLKAEIQSSFIYAISPTAKIEELENGNYLITITDKNGTTTAIINNVTQDTINGFIKAYFDEHPEVITDIIQEHNTSPQAHNDIRELFQNVLKYNDVLILDCGHAQTEY